MINWAQCQTRPVLMIPGPTELPFPVIQAMNQPPAIQYDRTFDEEVLEPTTLALREVFQTRGEVILLPGSGRTALEAGAQSVIEPGDPVLVVQAGQFGLLMREILTRAGAEVTEFPVEWGGRLDLDRLAAETERVRPKAITLVHNETSTGTTYPAADVGRIARQAGALFLLDTVSSVAGLDVRTDEWGVDLNMTGSQKCLAA
ncbi:MAG: pyridoxal-phosphate-dependent aminotransferase family protein, partial [Candidatus Rokuibacteriota bacterium]